jgi:cell division protein FtsL
MSAVPQRPGSSPVGPSQPAPAGLTVVPRVRRGRSARQARKVSKLGLMFRSNPVRVSIGLLVVAGVVFGLVLLNIHVAQTSFHLSDLQRQAAELQTEQRRLRYEVAKAESPEKIVEMGATLGLVAPAAQEYIDGPVLVAGGRPAEPDVAAQADSHAEQDVVAEDNPAALDLAAHTDTPAVTDEQEQTSR